MQARRWETSKLDSKVTSRRSAMPEAHRSRKCKFAKRLTIGVLVTILAGYTVPESLVLPVQGASVSDWNEKTFWFEPWGASGVHKGIDIFAEKGTSVVAAAGGLVVFEGDNKLGGNVVVVLGPRWRFHYYAHLDRATVKFGHFVSSGALIGSVGNSGNALGKQSHLHYAIVSAIPYPWRLDAATQGWKKIFFLDPGAKLRQALVETQ